MTTFGRMNEDGELEDVREIRQADLLACPFAILVADHYYPDGRCKCGDPTERARMIREWGYTEEDFEGIPVRIDPAYVEWCRRHFAFMREGGVWGIPRSGLIFTKRDGRLILTAAMPWDPAMEGTITADELRAQQDEEFESNRQHFAAADIEVVRAEEVQT
jgi:hypothetical protein